MIPHIPEDAPNPEDLPSKIQPQGWENLAGPFTWFRVMSENVKQDEEHGACIYVDTVPPVGELVQYFHEHRRWPRNAYLFAGQAGIGKTALIKLMAVTHVADDHTAVSYTGQQGQEIKLLDVHSEEPFIINPVVKEAYGFQQIQWALNNTGDTSHGNFEAYNAGNTNKSDVDSLVETFNTPLDLYGNRVVVINEFDGIGSRQNDSLKTALDRSNKIPNGLLLLADTNHLDKVQQSFDEAGMDRFKTIQFGGWNPRGLQDFAEAYVHAYDICFDESSFEEPPCNVIARSARGSIRDVIETIESLAIRNESVHKDTLQRIMNNHAEATSARNKTQRDYFFNDVVRGNSTVADLVKRGIQRSDAPDSFANDLAFRIGRYHHHILDDPEVGHAFAQLREIVQYRSGKPVGALNWSAMSAPIKVIASSLEERM